MSWIIWNGGECPCPLDAKVNVEFSNGDTLDNTEAGRLNWRHRHMADDNIVRYQIIVPYLHWEPVEDNHGGFSIFRARVSQGWLYRLDSGIPNVRGDLDWTSSIAFVPEIR